MVKRRRLLERGKQGWTAWFDRERGTLWRICLIAQYFQQSVHACAVHDGSDLGSVRDQQADALDPDVDNFRPRFRLPHPVVDAERCAVGSKHVRVDDIVALVKRHDFEDLKRFPGVGIETGGVGGNDKLAEQVEILVALFGCCRAPITAEHKFADCIEIKSFREKAAKLRPPLDLFVTRCLQNGDGTITQRLDEVSWAGIRSARPGAKRQEYGDQRNDESVCFFAGGEIGDKHDLRFSRLSDTASIPRMLDERVEDILPSMAKGCQNP